MAISSDSRKASNAAKEKSGSYISDSSYPQSNSEYVRNTSRGGAWKPSPERIKMKQDLLFKIAMERCLTGWHIEAIEEEQVHLEKKEACQLSIIQQNLVAMRQVAEGDCYARQRR